MWDISLGWLKQKTKRLLVVKYVKLTFPSPVWIVLHWMNMLVAGNIKNEMKVEVNLAYLGIFQKHQVLTVGLRIVPVNSLNAE